MEIRQIIYFVSLCEELHFTRAARRCGIAQPSLTNAIRALEREFGAPLFHRKPRPRLSELGAAVRPELERVLVHVGRALTHVRRRSSRRQSARPMRAECKTRRKASSADRASSVEKSSLLGGMQ